MPTTGGTELDVSYNLTYGCYLLTNGYYLFMDGEEEVKIKASIGDLEKESIKELWEHCPLCGMKSKTNKCGLCGFEWKKGYLYFSDAGSMADWEDGRYIDLKKARKK